VSVPAVTSTEPGTIVTAAPVAPVAPATSAATAREYEDAEKRIAFLQTTLAAQAKLAEEIQPDELAAHAGSDNPVAAAIAARRQQLAAVKDAHDRWVGQGRALVVWC
jgi:DNA-binding protein H-NS